MNWVVLWGLKEDGPLAAVLSTLARAGVPTVFIDQRRASEYTFHLEVDGQVSGQINGPHGRLNLAEAQSLYLRQYPFEQIDTLQPLIRYSEAWRKVAQFEEAMLLWSEIGRMRVVNRPSSMASNSSKPYQLELIRQSGFSVPDTIITSEPERVKSFHEMHGRIIYKSISSTRSVVSQLQSTSLESLADVAFCPTQFQQFIAGVDHRVHVLGGKVFAHRIMCDDDDYRYSTDARLEPVGLSNEVRERCISLTRRLGLVFSGIDLRQSPTGEWYCFEVNPSPGFTYFEDGGQAIREELAIYLAGTEIERRGGCRRESDYGVLPDRR